MAGDDRFRLIRQDNGLSAARNGLEQARGSIAFVDGTTGWRPISSAMVDALELTGRRLGRLRHRLSPHRSRHARPARCIGHPRRGRPVAPAACAAIRWTTGATSHRSRRPGTALSPRPDRRPDLPRRHLVRGSRILLAGRRARRSHRPPPRPLYPDAGQPGQITGQDDDRIAQQFDVLRGCAASSGRRTIHGDAAFARIAS